MTPAERKTLIAKYAAGYDEVVRSLAGIVPDERDWRPAPGEWSAREVVHHLADSETISGVRLRRLLIEAAPVIQGYDQADYARRFRYQERPWEPALRAFEAARSTTAQLLEAMTDADWGRSGTHTESGPYSAEAWLRIYAEHAHLHADQIRNNRTAWSARAR
jgi:DinB superfamily